MTRPSLNDLTAFVAVATHRSFRRAADELGTAPSTLSHAMRALECKLLADRMDGWLDELKPGEKIWDKKEIPGEAYGRGLVEGPRGALGHWIHIKGKKIDNYQAVVPTTWNAAPRDKEGNRGPIETALLGLPVPDAENPINVVRCVRSFDPCLACAIHVIHPEHNGVKSFRVV